MSLVIFYDSQCPLCDWEMQKLKQHDVNNRIRLVDLHGDEIRQAYPHVDPHQAMQRLHAQLDNGEMIYGLDVTCQAWNQVSRHRWLKLLRWPVIRPVADLVYRWFARHRSAISQLLAGKRRCQGYCGNREIR